MQNVETALGPTQPPIHWVQGKIFLEIKRPDRETEQLHLSLADVENQ